LAEGSAKTLRELNGLSLAEVGRAIDTSAATIWRWERGDRIPRGDLALRYGALLAELSGITGVKS
jgi:transcriptional regulator with XRE-family HTH domain